MDIEFNISQIRSLMIDYHNITGLRTALFDSNFLPVFSYPEIPLPICSLIQKTSEGRGKCRKSEQYGLSCASKAGKDCYVYQCHAGLLEICSPITYENQIVGYLLFGSLFNDIKNASEHILSCCSELIDDQSIWNAALQNMSPTPMDYIESSARILKACTYSIIQENLVKLREDTIWEAIDQYISKHIDQKITLQDISQAVFVSASTVSHKTKEITGQSVSNYIIRRKLMKASEYLSLTDYKVSKIADLVGIDNYNYFSRIFRKAYGLSPQEFRKERI